MVTAEALGVEEIMHRDSVELEEVPTKHLAEGLCFRGRQGERK